MIGAKYNPSAYRVLLKTNKNKKRLLVEGKDDKQLFKLLIDELQNNKGGFNNLELSIDTAETLIDFGETLGNREKVEKICESVSNTEYADRLVGFVDREFRGFLCNECIIDDLRDHQILGRLIWSRGHSIENYFFESGILRDALRNVLAVEWFDEAIKLFENVLESSMKSACALGLASYELKKIKKVQNSIHWSILRISSSGIELDIEMWKHSLIERRHLNLIEADQLVDTYKKRLRELEGLDLRVARWLCHGHIGCEFIWAVYYRCAFETCPESRRPESQIGNFRDEQKFNFWANLWVRKVIGNQCDHPLEALRSLGLEFF